MSEIQPQLGAPTAEELFNSAPDELSELKPMPDDDDLIPLRKAEQKLDAPTRWTRVVGKHIPSDQYRYFVKVNFNLLQRLRVLFGQSVFVCFHDGTPPAHVEYVAPKNWRPNAGTDY